jgi:hypothetical protein
MHETNEVKEKRLEAIQRVYDSNQELIYAADRKVSGLLLINAVLVSFSVTWGVGEYASWTKAIILVAMALSVLSTIMYLITVIPRVSKRSSESMLHYRGILGLPRERYVATMLEMSDDDLVRDYLDTIYALSSIQIKKNRYLALGSQFLILSIALLGLSFIVHNL